jgi:hypothetical protein
MNGSTVLRRPHVIILFCSFVLYSRYQEIAPPPHPLRPRVAVQPLLRTSSIGNGRIQPLNRISRISTDSSDRTGLNVEPNSYNLVRSRESPSNLAGARA